MAGNGSTAAWRRCIHIEEVWSTVVTIDVRGPELPADEVTALLRSCGDFTHDVDRWFSPFRADSAISAISRGDLAEAHAPAAVIEVLAGCRRARELTDGAFDPWRSQTIGLDACAYVKGWAADRLALMVTDAGYPNVCVNAGGDLACRGVQSPGRPWRIGLQHPYRRSAVMRVVEGRNEALATSGRYERGDHLVDPHTGAPANKLDSVTVVGPDGGLADALATALTVAGVYGVRFLSDLPGWSAYLVDGERAAMVGPAFE